MKSYWTILEYLPKGKVLAQCNCGVVKEVIHRHIKIGKSKSCRCHGRGAHLKEVRAWTLMKYRCNTKTSPDYANYGGRGIRVCERWMDFDNFFADMGIMPFKGATVERKNVDGDYEPSNCCWLSAKEQAKNRRSTRWIEFEGKRVQLQEAILKVGFKTSTVRERLRRGWSIEDALTISPKPSIKERPDFSQNFSS